MYYFTPDTIVQANKNIENLDSKIGGLLCILHCLSENIEENISYTIDGVALRRQLSLVFDKNSKDSFEGAKASYIIFARDWVSTFYKNIIKNKVDLLSCAVFFLRRCGFEKELSKEDIIEYFIQLYNLKNYKDIWFYDGDNLKVEYNQNEVEANQVEFYNKMNYTDGFKSILFRGVIQKSAADLKAAGQIQTLYSGSVIQKCFLLSDESLDHYYVMRNSKSSEIKDTDELNEYQRAANMLLQFQSETGFEIPIKQEDIDACRNEFMDKYAPDKLAALSGMDLLSKIFYTSGDNSEALCYWIERNAECRANFGSIAGGSAYKFGLFQKNDTGVWMSGSSQKPQELSEEEAIALGTEIRDALVKGVEIIQSSTLDSLEAYEKLDDDLKEQIGEKYYNWAWFHKYFAMVCPHALSCYHNNDWQNHILYGCGIKPSSKYYARSGQIAMIENYTNLSYRRFFSVANEKFGRPKTFVRIGTTGDDKNYVTEWSQRSVVGIGWNALGSLEDYVSGDSLDKNAIASVLEENYYSGDKSTSSRKAGELIRFYKADQDVIFVAMTGQKLVAFADEVGAYFFDANTDMGHNKPAKWHMKFKDGEMLPVNTEGLRTSCVAISNEENLMFLYKRYYFDVDTDDTDRFNYQNKDLDEREKMFIEWMRANAEANGEEFNETSKKGYAYALRKAASKIDGFSYPSDNLFYYSKVSEMQEIDTFIRNASNFAEVNRSYGNGQLSAGLIQYIEFLKEVGDSNMASEEIQSYIPLIYKTKIDVDDERNRIVFGAPGTGKSYTLNEQANNLIDGTDGMIERVTFHPDYTYSQFVGAYKPTMDGKDIRYEFVPGPFMRVYVEALKSGRTENPQPFLLIVEEINRAKVAGVFGDIFQLLDRDDDGVSVYEIQASEDIKKYLAEKLGGAPSNYSHIQIPNNMFIWATMNSADQGVFPMDTAFKRRWSFEYLGIDAGEDKLPTGGKFTIAGTEIEWNKLRKGINAKMTSPDFHINEDKLMGPFFLSGKLLKSDDDGNIINPQKFIDVFKSKVLMYLYEDAIKQRKHDFFHNCDTSKYSSVCDAFDKHGVEIFGSNFMSDYYDK